MAWINSRTRSRRPASIGSNQLSKRSTAVSVWGCERSGCVLMIVMAWSPVRRFNAGRFEVEHPGDYATFNSYQPRYGTRPAELPMQMRRQQPANRSAKIPNPCALPEYVPQHIN